ncbi:MAG: HYR domain-containing protein [Saprospiraceae bacterium]|nr:HYR domain-containing protein [Saprospiraceae bacterium]
MTEEMQLSASLRKEQPSHLVAIHLILIMQGGDGNDVVLSKCAAGIVNTNTGEIFCSIQDAINDPQTVNGHTITIAAGTYAENVVVNKELTISGAGKGSNPATNTVITPSISCIGAGFTISAANVTLQNMFITNFQDAVLLSGVTNPTLNNLALIDYCRYGVNFGGNNSDVEISNTDIQRTSLLAGTIGMRIGTANAVNGMLIDNCTITGNALQGIVNFQATTPVAFDNIVIKNSTISNNLQKGMYFEKLSNATFEKLTMDNNGTDATYGFNNGIDINLKYGSYSNITIKDCDITNSGVTGTAIDPQNPAVIAIKARDDAPSYNSIPASLSNVIIKNNKITGPQNAIRIGEFGKINATPSNVTIEGNDLSFAYANKALISRINNDISVNCNWHGTIDLPVILTTFEEGSSGDIILSTVLNSGTDASGDVGFQPSGGCICASNNLVTNTTTLETFCSIQEAIDDPQTLNGHTLMVGAGTYVENIIVNKQLTINGPNSNIDPCTGTRGSEAKVFPAIKAISYGEIFHVAASNVTISGFTIDGDNPSLTSGYTSTNGADLDAAEGVTIYETGINNLTVNRNIFKNLSYFGVTLYDYPAAVPSSGHTISQNKFQDFGTYDASSGIDFWGGGVLLYNNQYAWVKDNCMTNLRIGVQTGNFHLANPGTVSFQMIENNTMEVRRRGVFHNLFYGTASPYSMVNNTITGINNANESFWDGILISSQSVTSTATDNSIDGVAIVGKPTEGYEVWNVKNSSPILINGGLVSNTTIGLFVNNYEGYVSDAGDGAHATVSGITISACSTAVKIFDSPSSTLHAAVSAIIKDDCEINNTGTGTGILVSGTNASATIKDNDASINGFAVGVDIDGASAIVEGNHIYDNGMGVRFTNSGTGTVKTNKFYDTDLNDVDIHATGSAGSVIATPNNWFAGSSFGIENLSGNDIDATLNYWNHTSGPGLIAGGSGAKITTYVIYCPWLGDVPVPFGGTGLPLVSPTVNIDVTETSFGTNNDGMICNGDMVSLDATTTAAISYSWMPGGATTPSITVTPSSTTTFTVTVSFSDCQVVQTQTITVKQSPTFTTCPGSTTVNTDLNECNANVIYTATASGDPTPTYTYSFSGATSGSGAGTGSGSAFLLGVTTVTITAINGCTPDVCLFTITVNDMQNPVPSCESAQTINLNASCQLLVPDLTNGATATDNCSISFTWTQSPTSATLLASGEGTTHTVTVTANDGNGNSATCTVVLTGDDTTAPIPDCENNQTLSLNANCEITVPDKTNAATATDNCSISFTWTQNPLQGAMLPSGEGMMHVVTVTVSDGNGNSSTCTSVLTGNDNTNPVPSCETAQTINLNASCQLLVPDLTDGATATDNCSTTFTWTQSPTSATLLASGEGTTHTVTVTANDGNGNSATCTVVLTGNDNTNPVPSCETAQTINLNSSCQMLVPDLTDGTTATDNCSTTFTWTQNPTSATLLASGEGTTHTVTVTANDGNGNSATCTVVLTGNDNTNPVPSCESAQTINLNSSCQLLVPDLTDAATATDNCSTTFTWTQNPTSATLLASGEGTTHTVTVTANDGNGNSATCTVVLTGNDNTNPVPSCETAQTININSSCQLLVPDLTDGATATDNCSTTFTWTQSPTSATLLASGEGTTHTVTVTANDGNGNSATCTVVLTGNDNTNPVPSCESAQTINLNASCQLLVPDLTDGASATDNCSTTLSWSQSPTTSTLLASGEGTTHTVTVTANDGNGNSATCTVVLTGNDNTNPVPSCESAQTINLNSSCQLLVPDLTDGASATDNCSTTLSWSQSPTTSTLLASGEGTTHTVTVTANDGNGNSATCTVVLTGNDNTNPVPSCESAQTINLNSSCQLLVPDLTDGASATDNCSTTFTWSQSPTSSTLLASGEGTTHTVTVTANDGNGNSATCTVVLTGNDNTNPVPSCESAQTINLNASCQLLVPDLTDGATATDNCSTTFTWSQSPTTSTLLASGEGTTHTVTVTANDGNGNSATCTVILTGNDNTNPVPICEPAQTIVLNATCQLLVPNLTDGATATDNCATTFTWSQSPTSGSLLASGEGTTHTVTVTASDGNGNSATCTVVLTGNDVTAPVPVCEDPQNVNLNANCQLLVPNLTDGSMATDNCVTTFNWSQNPNAGSILSSAHNLSHTITITVSDGNGNSSTCTTVLTGKDVTMPVMTCPGNQVRGMTEGLCRYVVQGSEFDGTASDNCGIITKTYTLTGIESGTGSGSLAGLYWKKGITTVKWVVTDAAGNTKSCSFTVNVKDLEPPTVTCPPDLIIITLPGQCSVPAGSVSLGTPTVSDNCGIKYPITNNSPSSYPVGVTNVKWTVKDSSNNVKTCIQKVTVVAYTCGQPVTVYHHDTTYSSAKVSWSAGTCASSYQLRIRKEISAGVWTSWSSWVNSSGPLTHLFNGLDDGSFYHYQIRSKCGTGNSNLVNGWFHTLTLPPLKKQDNGFTEFKKVEELDNTELYIKSSEAPELKAVPNPAKDLVSIQLNGFSFATKSLTMTDMFGKLIFNVILDKSENELELDLKQLNVKAGIHFIRVSDGVNQKTIQLLVVL